MLLVARRESGPQRLGWIPPLFGFVCGSTCYVLVQRDEELATLIAVMLLAGWIWLCLQPSIRHKFDSICNDRVNRPAIELAMRSIQQSILFFSLPFIWLATQTIDPGQVLISGVVVLAALISTIDSVYVKFLSRRQMPFVMFHCLCSFITGLVVLPIVLKIPADQIFGTALLLVLTWLVVGAPLNRNHSNVSIRTFLLTLLFPLLVWSSKDHIPPTGVLVENSVLTNNVDDQKPDRVLTEVTTAELSNGLYLFSSIRAPLGLSQEVIFNWRHGDHSEEMASPVSGGDAEGYRAYAVKRDFLADSVGSWTVDVLTAERQLLDRVEFEVLAAPSYSASFLTPRAAFSMPRVTGLVIKPSM